jgi:hypothetical protein
LTSHFFDKETALHNKYIDSFVQGVNIPIGSSRKIKIVFHKKEYNASLLYVNRTNLSPVHQMRWDQNIELINELKKEFIQTYFAIKSREYDSKIKENTMSQIC